MSEEHLSVVTIEILRAERSEDPFAFLRGNREYLRRLPGGDYRRARLDWDSIHADLLEVRQERPDPEAHARLGHELRAFILPTGFDSVERAILAADKRGEQVQVLFRFAAAELFVLPWELLHIGAGGYSLGSLPGVHVGYEWPGTEVGSSVALGTSRILVAWSAAGGAVPADQHIAAIRKACSQADMDAETDVGFVHNASLGAIGAALRSAEDEGRPFTVLHLLCHGAGASGLVLDHPQGEVSSSTEVKELLAQFSADLRLVLLLACRSSGGVLGSYLGSVSLAVHRVGIRAVVGCRRPLNVNASTLFTSAFYTELLVADPAGSLDGAMDAATSTLRERGWSNDALGMQRFQRQAHWHDMRPSTLREYREAVKQRADLLADVFRRAGGPQAVSQVYVEVQVTGRHGPPDLGLSAVDGDALHRRSLRLESVVELSHNRWALLGDPGSGKTTLLHQLALRLAGSDRLPILVRIPELCDEAGDLWAIVERLYDIDGLAGPLRSALESGKAVVLLDGLDEVVDQGKAARAVRKVARQAKPCPVIVASRMVGYEAPAAEFAELRILPLGPDEQRELLRCWVEDDPQVDRSLVQMRSRVRLARIAQNPLLLTLAGLVMRDGQEVPEQRGKLYELAVDLLLRKGHAGSASQRGRRLRHPDTAARSLGQVALRLHGVKGHAYRAREIHRVLEEDERSCDNLRKLYGSLEKYLSEVAETTALLVPDRRLATAVGYHFPHRTFREYLAATALEESIGTHGIGEVPREALNGAIPASRRADIAPAPGELGRVLAEAVDRPEVWSEVLALTCGLLGTGAGDALVRRVAAEGNADLVARVVAEAEGIRTDTVLAALGVERGGDNWEARRTLLEDLPSLVGDPEVIVHLVWRFVRSTRNGNDLWFARELLRRVGQGEITGRVLGDVAPEAVRDEANDLSSRVFDHIDGRANAIAAVETLLRRIPAGSFLMGSPGDQKGRAHNEGPQHLVVFHTDFEIMSVPVTNAMYELFDPEHKDERPFSRLANISKHPVVNITWWEARMFAEWVGCDLPTEAEWECAARAGSTGSFWNGDHDFDLFLVGWFAKNSGAHTHPVGEKDPNSCGLHDVHGNVWEWCSDHAYRPYSEPIEDPSVPWRSHRIAHRIVRGGSWSGPAEGCRSACRGANPPDDRLTGVGVRLVRRCRSG